MKVGFTGTQAGMSPAQAEALYALLKELKPDEFHHGDCMGADREAHLIVSDSFPTCSIIVHPPTDNRKRAFMMGREEREPKEYIQRNRHIVVETDVLIATPKEMKEVLRSGTWSTLRFSININKPHYLIRRDGTVVHTLRSTHNEQNCANEKR